MESFFLSNKNYESVILIAYGMIEFFHLFIFLIALLKTNRPPFTDKKLYRFPPFLTSSQLEHQWVMILLTRFQKAQKTEEEVQCKTIWRETIWSNLESSKNHLNGTFYKLNYDYGKELNSCSTTSEVTPSAVLLWFKTFYHIDKVWWWNV